MGLGQTFGHLLQMTQKLWQIRLPTVSVLAQRLPIDELHRDEVHTVSFTDFIDVRDVRMVQRSGGLCFLLKAAQSIFVLRQLGGKYLESDFAMQPRIIRQINLTHSARA